MRINTEMVSKMNPCKDRFDNFKNHYPNYDGDFIDFLALDNITYGDKVWVTVRLLNKNQLVNWSILCAESVKHYFNDKYPDNKALDNLFAYLKTIPDFENLTDTQREEIRKHRAYATDADAADADADAAAYAAADTAYAAYAAAYAYAAYAAYTAAADADAAYAAYAAYAADADAAAAAREEQRNLNLLYLASVIE